MAQGLLDLHNVVRWVVVIAAVLAAGNAYRGWLAKTPFEPRDARLGTVFTGAMDLQVLLGIVVYIVSPLTSEVFEDFGGAMGDETLRFYGVEHGLVMIVAAALAHVGTARARKADDDVASFRTQAIWYSVAILAILFAIPWDRALLPGM